MAQEFNINSSAIETKINQLLPSQGGFGAGVDFSASTMVIPIVDLTETAEGSNVRVDLQTALSFTTANTFAVNNTTTTIITTTGYWRILGTICTSTDTSTQNASVILNDGSSDKTIYNLRQSSNQETVTSTIDLLIFLKAGHSCKIRADNPVTFDGSARQIADINGNLIDP